MSRRQLDIDLFRGLLRKMKYAKGRSSYPFISGDTFAALCDYQFKPETSLNSLKKNTKTIKLFLPAHLKDHFLFELKLSQSDFSSDILVIHNYDNIPNKSEMAVIAKRFKKVYSVNWLGDKTIATPIPIGLENWSLLRNGVPTDFLKLIEQGLPHTSKRPIRILSSFSIETNPKERSKALEYSKSSSDVFQMPAFTSPRKYREMLSNSAFVLSPPGNGVDCHRTWEAIYLGAIPIVLKKCWPFSHIDLPVLVVDDWSDIPKLMSNSNHWDLKSVDDLRSKFLNFE